MAVSLALPGQGVASAPRMRVSILAKAHVDRERDQKENETTKRNVTTTTSIKSTKEVCSLQVKLKNSEKSPVSGTLKWCFIADHSSGKTKNSIPAPPKAMLFASGSKEVTVGAGQVIEESLVSNAFKFEEKNILTDDYSKGKTTDRDYETGDVYEGFLVVLVVDGRVVAKKSNTSRYQKEEWIQKCLTPPKKQDSSADKKSKKSGKKK